MIGLDTNVLVRYVADDDPVQIDRAHGCAAAATFDRKAAKLDGFIRVA